MNNNKINKNILNIFDKPISKYEAFKIKDIIIEYATKNAKSTIDMSRGDPCYPPSIEAQKVFTVLNTVATLVQEKLGQASSPL